MWYGLTIADWSIFLECSEHNGINCWGNPCNFNGRAVCTGKHWCYL